MVSDNTSALGTFFNFIFATNFGKIKTAIKYLLNFFWHFVLLKSILFLNISAIRFFLLQRFRFFGSITYISSNIL